MHGLKMCCGYASLGDTSRGSVPARGGSRQDSSTRCSCVLRGRRSRVLPTELDAEGFCARICGCPPGRTGKHLRQHYRREFLEALASRRPITMKRAAPQYALGPTRLSRLPDTLA